MWKTLSLAALAAVPFFNQDSVETTQQARELGTVQWERTLEPALERSAADHKPILLLFQEVPG
ncbi:MAG: hypothetical protein P1V35_16700 [Planctomycetota bacterium]|nr:hypothetical protein [Planctomycetota bacterium]